MNTDFHSGRQEELLHFWFGRLEPDDAPSDHHVKMWFKNSGKIDAEIKFRFELDLKRALEEKLNTWLETSRGSLAFIILIDQFSRNIYRDTPRAFEGDPRALKACLSGIEKGLDINQHPVERLFYYMPLMHSEDLEIQMTSLECFTMLEKLYTSPPSIASIISRSKMYAEKHYLLIEKFGRFPHRNGIVGRRSTPAELQFLKDSGYSL